MSRSRNPGDGQEPMIIQATEQPVIAAEALPLVPGTAVTNRLEQALHLVTVLQNFNALIGQEDWLRAARSPTSALHRSLYLDFDKKGNDIISGRQRQHDEKATATKHEFYKALGRNSLVDAGLLEPAAADAMAEQEYATFEQRYRGQTPIRQQRRADYKGHLMGIIETMPSAVAAQPQPVEAPISSTAKPNLTAKTALARMLTPEFQGLQAAKYDHLSNETVAQCKPAQLRNYLVQVGSRTPNAVGYVRDGESRPTFVAVSPLVRPLTRSVEMLAESAVDGSLAKQDLLTGEVLDTDKPRRAGIHAVEKRQAVLEKHRTNVIDSSLASIDQFEEALLHNAGLARFGSEAKARMKLAELQATTFDEMFKTIAANAKYNTRDNELMQLSVEKAIYFAPTAAGRRNNFASFLGLAKEWRLAQAELFDSLLATCANYIDKHQPHDQ